MLCIFAHHFLYSAKSKLYKNSEKCVLTKTSIFQSAISTIWCDRLSLFLIWIYSLEMALFNCVNRFSVPILMYCQGIPTLSFDNQLDFRLCRLIRVVITLNSNLCPAPRETDPLMSPSPVYREAVYWFWEYTFKYLNTFWNS